MNPSSLHTSRRTAAWALLVIVLASHLTLSVAGAEEHKWAPWFGVGGFYGTDDSSRAEGILFVPFVQSDSTLAFTDVRGKWLEEGAQEYNLAIGLRRMLDNEWNIGGWAGFDARESAFDNSFFQLSAGLEALHPNWDVRVNSYLPLSDPQQAPGLAEVQISGNQIFMVGGTEVPLHGIDAEFGVRVPLERLGGDTTLGGRQHELRVYAGGFWFDGDDAAKSVTGPKARAAWSIDDIIGDLPGSRLTLEAEYSHDDVRNSHWEVGLRLSVPLSFKRTPRNAAWWRASSATPTSSPLPVSASRSLTR